MAGTAKRGVVDGNKVINNEDFYYSMQYKYSLVRMNKFDPEMAMEERVLSSYVPPISAWFKISPVFGGNHQNRSIVIHCVDFPISCSRGTSPLVLPGSVMVHKALPVFGSTAERFLRRSLSIKKCPL